MAAVTDRKRLGYFVDAAVEMLPASDLKMTPMTRYCFDGVDRDLVDRILWSLEDKDALDVARTEGVAVAFVYKVAAMSGANGRQPAG